MPRLSIITVNLNNSTGLQNTMKSVKSQSFTDYEHIVIDGGSTDNSVAVIKNHKDNVSYWISEPDTGIYNAMNKGIMKAKGEYIQFLNSGDTFTGPEILKKVFKKNSTEDILYGHVFVLKEEGGNVYKMPDSNQISLNYFFLKSISHPAAFIKRDLFSNNLYDESYSIAADKKFFIEQIIIRNCSLRLVDEVIVNFDSSGVSSKPENILLVQKEENRIMAQLFPPRLFPDYAFYKSNYADILALNEIKQHKILHLIFGLIKRAASISRQRFSLKTALKQQD